MAHKLFAIRTTEHTYRRLWLDKEPAEEAEMLKEACEEVVNDPYTSVKDAADLNIEVLFDDDLDRPKSIGNVALQTDIDTPE